MEKCKDCCLNKIKDTKSRPMCCASCELNFHCGKLVSSIADLLLLKIPTIIINYFKCLIAKFIR